MSSQRASAVCLGFCAQTSSSTRFRSQRRLLRPDSFLIPCLMQSQPPASRRPQTVLETTGAVKPLIIVCWRVLLPLLACNLPQPSQHAHSTHGAAAAGAGPLSEPRCAQLWWPRAGRRRDSSARALVSSLTTSCCCCSSQTEASFGGSGSPLFSCP